MDEVGIETYLLELSSRTVPNSQSGRLENESSTEIKSRNSLSGDHERVVRRIGWRSGSWACTTSIWRRRNTTPGVMEATGRCWRGLFGGG